MIVPVDEIYKFKLSNNFLEEYKEKEVEWGFGDFSYIVFKRTYARRVEGEDRTEEWWETCRRVVEGMFNIQKAHCSRLKIPWDNRKAQNSAQDAYDRMFRFLWSPPGRGLWVSGTDFIYERSGAPLNNCGFVSTESIKDDYADPFCWMFGMSCLGVGVGYDARGASTMTIKNPNRSEDIYTIGDSREGWVEALKILLSAFAGKGSVPKGWDFSKIRKKGAPIKTFGGVASGPEPLKEMLKRVEELHVSYIGKEVDSTLICDTMNLIAKCVVSGGVRRSALISLGNKDDEEFALLKTNQEKLNDYRWASNNSVFAEKGMDYSFHAAFTAKNGEPGYAFMENVHQYGRTKDPKDYRDKKAMGFNPCGEQPLESKELCTLVETYPARHETINDYRRTLKFAYLYAKTVTLVPTHSEATNAVMMKNRRIGCSMSGVAQNIAKIGLRGHLEWCDEGYDYIRNLDKKYSDWMCVPRSIRTTTVKPSGTVSLLSGATPGLHHGISEYYIRRMRIADNSPIWKKCEEAGYHVENDKYAPNTKVVSFPVKVENFDRGEEDLSIWEQVNLAALMQEYWSDNAVSCTVKFKKEEAGNIPRVLEAYEHKLKGISFLPHSDHGYEQAPYEKFTEEEYEEMASKITKVDLNESRHEVTEKFCDGDTCTI